MSAVTIGALSVLVICVLIFAGMHIAVALILCSFVGVWLIKGNVSTAADLLGMAAADSIASYDLAVVPLFVLMGLLINATTLPADGFRLANHFLRRVKGGVGIATVLGNAVMSAVTGVTIASVAIFTKIAVPQMVRLGYKPRFAVGLVAGSGVLGMMIPPSLLIIIYCLITEQSVGRMFIGAIGPGLLLTAALCVGVFLMAWKWKSFVGEVNDTGKEAEEAPTPAVIAKTVGPLALMILCTFGGLYGGIFTAPEAGAVGAFMAFVVAMVRGDLNRETVRKVLLETGSTTSAICILIVAANMYGRLIALSGMPNAFTAWLAQANLGFYALIWVYVLLLLVLGTALDSISTVLLSVPLLLPTFAAYQVDLIWIGVITVLAVEMGIVTPPLGISAFVVKGALQDRSISLGDIYAGSMPFIAIIFIVLALLITFPAIMTALL